MLSVFANHGNVPKGKQPSFQLTAGDPKNLFQLDELYTIPEKSLSKNTILDKICQAGQDRKFYSISAKQVKQGE